MPRKKKPGYWHHKPSGQAYVRLDGKDHYLGEYNSPESRDRYDEIVREWTVNQSADGVTLTVDELALRYLQYARQHYRKNGEETSEVSSIMAALRVVVRAAGRDRARDFGPLKLQAVRTDMIAAGWKRKSINIHIGRIRRMFQWAASQELLPVQTLNALQTVAGLREGRTEAAESIPVQPVSEAAVDAVRPHVSRQVWAMIQLQLVTGMRPGEVTAMRGCDLTMCGPLWEYSPESHKTQHHGRKRIIVLGPQAQAIIRQFLKTDMTAFLFSPAEARAEFDAQRLEKRRSPLTPSQKARKPKSKPERKPGERYTVASYGSAVRKGCEKAHDMPRELRNVSTKLPATEREQLQAQARAWREQHCWHPHQLRHTAATSIRRTFGIEAAQVVLGHANIATAEIYAEKDRSLAERVMQQLG
ncbi:MAG: site-specific integrase [Planctomycetaceae bacterium]|nr:site-specific integrase [Planctomycetaceae bacterium]